MEFTAEQKRAIYEDGSNILISAGAGSGKTEILSERVINKLKNNIHVNELLILTFTNAAALEMKERIRKKIKNEPALQSELNLLDSAYITTFDAYALALVKKYHYLLNIDSDIKISETSIINLKKKEILDNIFTSLYEKKDEKFLNLITSFCTKDDNELKKSLLLIDAKLDLKYDKEKILDDYLDIYFSDNFLNNKVNDYENMLLNKKNTLIELIKQLENISEESYIDKIEATLTNLNNIQKYEDFNSCLINLPTLPRNSSDEVKKLKEKINDKIKDIRSLCSVTDKEEFKEELLKTKENVLTIINILKEFNLKVLAYKREWNFYEFSDIFKMAIKIVEENETIREKIKDSFKEIMIDEYQDTNDLQDIFISYIAKNNVYMVGDIKQSIYRFRNANPNLFKEKYNTYNDKKVGIKIDLNKNFRSRVEVIDDINLLFNKIMDENYGGADYLKSHQLVFGNLIYNQNKANISNNLEIYNYSFDKTSEFKKEEIESFIIAYDIKNKINNGYLIYDKNLQSLRKLEYTDIVILMDRANNFSLYKKIFEYLNIPLAIDKDESITDSIDIALIKNLLYLLINDEIDANYKFAFISVMRSFLYEVDDEEIFDFFLNNNFKESEVIKNLKQISVNDTLSEILVNIIDKVGFYEKIIKVGDVDKHLAVLDYLLKLAKDLANIGYDIHDFYNFLSTVQEEKYNIPLESEKPKDGVKIMTIHRSKGLEYPVCYYSGLYADFNIADLKERFMYDNNLGMIIPYFEDGIKMPFTKELLKDSFIKEEISEKIRLFYVALTRAREKMIIVTPNLEEESSTNYFDKGDFRSFLDFLKAYYETIKSKIKDIDLNDIPLTKEYNFVNKEKIKISGDANKIVVNEKVFTVNEVTNKQVSKEINSLISKEEFEKLSFGRKIHALFENVNFKNPDFILLTEFEQKLIKNFLNQGLIKDNTKIYKEYEFTFNNENNLVKGIIDLLLEDEDEFTIIDYKLKNISDEEYEHQLHGYKDYLKNMTDKKIKTYLYSILDNKLEEIK